MKTSEVGINLIKSFEGLELEAYRDAVGVLTIGYGHTKGVRADDEITEEEAEELLQEDLEHFEKGVLRLVNIELEQYEFDALVSFSYNLGLGNLKKSTLLRKLNNSDNRGAANEFKRWNRAGGRVLRGLTRRRLEEEQLFKGEF